MGALPVNEMSPSLTRHLRGLEKESHQSHSSEEIDGVQVSTL